MQTKNLTRNSTVSLLPTGSADRANREAFPPLRRLALSVANVKIIPYHCFSENHFFHDFTVFFDHFPKKYPIFSAIRRFLGVIFRKTPHFFSQSPKITFFEIFRFQRFKRTLFNHNSTKETATGAEVGLRTNREAGEFCYFVNNFLLQLANYFVPLRAISKRQGKHSILISKQSWQTPNVKSCSPNSRRSRPSSGKR